MPGRRAGDPAGDPRLPGFIKRLNLLLASNLEPQAILAGIVEDVMAMLGAADGCIRLMGPEDRVGRTMFRRAAQSGSWPREVAISVMGYLADGRAHLATPDLLEDRRFSGLRAVETRVRAVLAVPLTVSQRTIGVLAVSDPRPGRRWSDEQLQLLSMAANYSAEPLLRAQRRDESRRAELMGARLAEVEKEMAQARLAQMSLLPMCPLVVADWEVQGEVIPARLVGGDLFHCFAGGDQMLGIAVADVEGKGMGAAVTMALVRGALGEMWRTRVPVEEAMDHVGRVVAGTRNPTRVTMFYGQFDPTRGLLRYSSAGHPPAIVRRRDGTIEPLREGGPLFGLFDRFDYPVGETALRPDEALLAYSDGVTEAMNEGREFFGEDRLWAVWSSCADRPPQMALRSVREAVERHRGAAEQADDITLMVLGPAARSRVETSQVDEAG